MSSHRTTRTPQPYKIADWATEGLLYAAIIFAPWAFGTTQPWSISLLNYAGYAMGLLLAAKWLICWKTGFHPAYWMEGREPSNRLAWRGTLERFMVPGLFVLSLLALVYCLVSFINARATYHHEMLGFTYHERYVSWLPHSYDSQGTWTGFKNYLALFFFFWATRNWLLGKTHYERHQPAEDARLHSGTDPLLRADLPPPFPARMRRILWVLCLNGAVLGLVSILQRLDGTTKLLWIVEPRVSEASNHFGPYAYRSNAAQYFNLLWPLSFGFWWSLHQWHHQRLRLKPRLGSGPHLLLLPISILIAACPIVSTSRGGALLCFAGLPLVMGVIYTASHRRRPWKSIPLIFLCLLSMGLYLGWAPLKNRLLHLQDISKDVSSMERLDQYTRTWQMVRDYPLFGIGPNAYEATYPLYRTPGRPWYPFAHNDWLQFLVEWGILGFSILCLGLISCLLFPWAEYRSDQSMTGVILVSLVLVLAHGAFDFPFQISSILFTFTILLALYTTSTRMPHA